MMQFESLANDTLLDLFEYFDTIHLLHAFFGLNYRLNTLLYKYFRSYHVNFQHISKRNFEIFCQQHLYSIADKVISLSMTENNETPGLLKRFLSYGFNINQFTNLRSLTLFDIWSTDLDKFLNELRHLTHLIYLNFNKCDISFKQRDDPFILNKIWSLPKLTHCKIDNCYKSEIYFNEFTSISPMIERLSIHCPSRPLKSSDLVYLFLYTPRLQVLSILIELNDEYEQSSIITTSITSLNLAFIGDAHRITKLFCCIPCLRHLTIDMGYDGYNGHEWKQIIVHHIPKLEIFRFKMLINSYNIRITNQQANELLDTFRTSFWLIKHQWYVRCDWKEELGDQKGYECLYTVPYAFDTFTDPNEGVLQSKMTCPDDEKYWSFNRVRKFDWKSRMNDRLRLYPGYFPNIHKLAIKHPLIDTIWHTFPTLNHLTHLRICMDGEDSETKIQALLDRAPHLYTLTIELCVAISIIKLVFKLTSTSIRHIRFNPYVRHGAFDFDDKLCTEFVQSSLARQCEVLEIRVQSEDNIIYLLNSMTNLRTMTIYLRDFIGREPFRTSAGLIEWAEKHLSTRCLISDCTHLATAFVIRMWID